MSVSSTSSSITVQWGAVDCIHRNGDITGYSVRYGVQTVSVSGGGATQTTISGLTPSTNYSIEVAAMNIVGPGPYSSVIFQLTEGLEVINVYFSLLLYKFCISLYSHHYLISSSSSSLVSSWINNSHHHLPLLDQCWLSGDQL